jgi:hypothetical protein
LTRDALLTTLHPLLENMLQAVCHKLQDDSGTGSFDLLITSKFLAWSCLFMVGKAQKLHHLCRLDG